MEAPIGQPPNLIFVSGHLNKNRFSLRQWLCGSVGRPVASTPEVSGSNPVIGEFLCTILLYCQPQLKRQKMKKKEKEAENDHFNK